MTQYIGALFQASRDLCESVIQTAIVFMISMYQRCISPIKGFSCAYRIQHKTESCSSYIKQAFIEQNLHTAILLSKQRFRDCAEAAELLTAQHHDSQPMLYGDMGRRSALRFFSLFTVGMFATRAQSGCPGIQVCCSGLVFNDDDDDDDDDDD